MLKKCGKCKKIKSITKFNKTKDKKDGYHSQCRECCKEYYQIHKVQINECNKKYRQARKKQLNENAEIYRKTHKKQCKFNSYKCGAKKRNLFFGLSFEIFSEFLSNSCIYCGSIKNIGIDRIDNNKGYVKQNCAPCCTTCNLMRNSHSQKDFLTHIEKIYIFRGKN